MQTNLTISLPSGPSFDMIHIEGDTFDMGSNENKREQPVHPVTIPSFYLGKHQVTQALWKAVMGQNPSRFQGENRPVENVSWLDAQGFIKKLNQETGKTFRLPSEAEWEYAARGGIYSQGYDYCGSDKLKQVGWYKDNSNNETHDVGLLLANELGLYDMSGNVWEWCEDDYHGNYNGAQINGSAWVGSPKRGDHRVMRGGNYFDFAEHCRPSNRNGDTPDSRGYLIGFRLCLSLQSVG